MQRMLQTVSQRSAGPVPMESDDPSPPISLSYTNYIVYGDLDELPSPARQALERLPQEFTVCAPPQP